MRYFGGKYRIAHALADYLNSQLKPGQTFYDMFCGSCNVVSKVKADKRVANDKHPELMALHKHVQSGGDLPSNVTFEEYKQLKSDTTAPAWLRGFVGFGCSFAGRWWEGYARGNRQNYASCAKNSLQKKHNNLKDVAFFNKDYSDVELDTGSLVYCDIPYKSSTKRYAVEFDHQEFYAWAQTKALEGHTVLVSEYAGNVPAGWDVVWALVSKKGVRNAQGLQEATQEVLMKPKM